MKGQRIGRSVCAKTGKVKHASYFAARNAAREVRDQTGQEHGRPYRCGDCGGWHLGRSSWA